MRQTLGDRLSMVYTRDEGQELFTSHTWKRLFEIRAPLLGGLDAGLTWRQFFLALYYILGGEDFWGPPSLKFSYETAMRRHAISMIAYNISGQSNEKHNAAGEPDTRPPMLVESDYDSWKIRIHRYIRGKPNGKQIWKSIQNGPTPHPMITDPPATDSAASGLPRPPSSTSSSNKHCKGDLDHVESLSKDHNYSTKEGRSLVNDMKITQLNIPTHQMNTKFVNNLLGYWENCQSLKWFPEAVSTHQQPAPDFLQHKDFIYVHDGQIVTDPFSEKAPVLFMANLSSTSATTIQSEVHSNDNQIFDNVDYQLNQEMHQEKHLDSDAETEIDDNTIPYHQYLLDTKAQNVPTEVSADTSDKVSMIAILTDLQT
ncbi:hypothetical protein Tco_0318387 [Tanacetum coccineum]